MANSMAKLDGDAAPSDGPPRAMAPERPVAYATRGAKRRPDFPNEEEIAA